MESTTSTIKLIIVISIAKSLETKDSVTAAVTKNAMAISAEAGTGLPLIIR